MEVLEEDSSGIGCLWFCEWVWAKPLLSSRCRKWFGCIGLDGCVDWVSGHVGQCDWIDVVRRKAGRTYLFPRPAPRFEVRGVQTRGNRASFVGVICSIGLAVVLLGTVLKKPVMDCCLPAVVVNDVVGFSCGA